MRFLEECIYNIRESCARLPDKRKGANSRYSMADIGMAPLAMFFMQQPSFLAFQRTLNARLGRDNTQTLFCMDRIPTDNHIRTILDGVPPHHFDEDFFFIINTLPTANPLVGGVLGGHSLIALDGSEYHCSKKICCSNCSKRRRADGEVEYFHTFFAATLVHPHSRNVLSLPPEFILPQDGAKKQDCEWRAANRWLDKMGSRCLAYNPVYLGDDLFSKHYMCKRISESGAHFIFTCKDSSHKTLREFRRGLPCQAMSREEGKGEQKKRFEYRWMYDLPLRDGEDAISVNWIDVTISHKNGKVTYHTSFITNLKPDRENVAEIVKCGRTRWKIENETFNVLKNNGYHLEHNFGHGKDTLSCVLIVLNLLAFNLHNGCDMAERLWQEARAKAGTKKRLFSLLWSLAVFIIYPTWNSLLGMIATGRHPPTD